MLITSTQAKAIPRKQADKKGFSKVCKLCNKKKDAERYQKKKDKILIQKKRYYRRQKEQTNGVGEV